MRDIPTWKIYLLNESGALIWKLCDEVYSVIDIADVLVGKYGVDRDTAIKDVLEVVLYLEKVGMIGW